MLFMHFKGERTAGDSQAASFRFNTKIPNGLFFFIVLSNNLKSEKVRINTRAILHWVLSHVSTKLAPNSLSV